MQTELFLAMKIRESPQRLRVLPLFPKHLTKSQISYLSMNQRSYHCIFTHSSTTVPFSAIDSSLIMCRLKHELTVYVSPPWTPIRYSVLLISFHIPKKLQPLNSVHHSYVFDPFVQLMSCLVLSVRLTNIPLYSSENIK